MLSKIYESAILISVMKAQSFRAWFFVVGCGALLLLIVFLAYPASAVNINPAVSVQGSVSVLGAISKGSGTFMIDHPLDPKNKLLYHSFVESPDVLNIYDGIVVLDADGRADVDLPLYFLALNKDFTYLTTPVGSAMPNLYIEKGIRRPLVSLTPRIVFTIAGGKPSGKVSWQVTGVRHDSYILANPIVPEVKKGPDQLVNVGEYLFPAFYAAGKK